VYDNSTIAAISTPLGEGGIGIVKISGNESFNITKKIFHCRESKKSGYPAPRYLYHGYIKDEENRIVDEVLTSFMPAPKTYTREDIVEINCHSGIFALRTILKIVINSGARLAEPGEFTRRAFLNGRIDLSQAEAVINIIRARSEEAVRTAARVLSGGLTEKIENIRSELINLRAPIEAMLDYPEEYDYDKPDLLKLNEKLLVIHKNINDLLKGVEVSRVYQNGVNIAIVGQPNVGKSSLLNALLRQQKAIVHETPGTTRDLLEGYMNLGGYPLRLVDTAGIQGTEDPVEKEGIARSRNAAREARLLLMVLDGSIGWSAFDTGIADLKEEYQGLVVVINKADLEQKITPVEVNNKIPDASVVKTVATRGEGIDALELAVAEQLDRVLGSAPESPVIVTLRQEEILTDALLIIDDTLEALYKQPLEIISSEMQRLWMKLGEITGATMNGDLLDKVFSEFCLGK